MKVIHCFQATKESIARKNAPKADMALDARRNVIAELVRSQKLQYLSTWFSFNILEMAFYITFYPRGFLYPRGFI